MSDQEPLSQNGQCVGVDLLQKEFQTARRALEESAVSSSKDDAGPALPSVVLPFYEGEEPIVGTACGSHRRGLGLTWPPEAQFPYRKNDALGVGRVPLISAWMRLFLDAWNDRARLDNAFGWQPESNRPKVEIKPTETLAKSFVSLLGDRSTASALIVPDRMSDGALAVLNHAIDGAKTLSGARHSSHWLLWRSAALGIAWCRRYGAELNSQENSGSGDSLGHIITLSMALDDFEVSVCEVVKHRAEGTDWVLPVVDRNVEATQRVVGPNGLSFLAALLQNETGPIVKPDVLWRRLMLGEASERACSLVASRETLGDLLRSGRCRRLSEMGRASSLLGDVVLFTETEGGWLKDRFAKAVHALQQGLPAGQSRQLLGVVVDGSLSKVRVTEERTVADLCLDAVNLNHAANERRLIGEGELSTQGAADFAWCAHKGLPTYLERLRPLKFFARGKTREGDPEAVWVDLVPGETIMGGKAREFDKQEGLSIEKGAEELSLILRSTREGQDTYRQVPVVLKERAKQDDPVELIVKVEAGQGYAKVIARGVNTRLHHLLDWNKMEEAEEPVIEEPPWIQQVWRLDGSKERWEESIDNLIPLLEAFRSKSSISNVLGLLKSYRDPPGGQGRLNAFSYPDDTWKEPWQLYHPIGSGGRCPVASEDSLLDQLNEGLLHYFHSSEDAKLQAELVRVSAWTFKRMPPEFRKYVLEGLRRAMTEPEKSLGNQYLTAAGHVFEDEEELALVFKATAAVLSSRPTGINHWLRAIRNMVKFRQDALNPRVVSRKDLDAIVGAVLTQLENQMEERNYANIFRNCLQIFMFLFKRRRDEEDFPSGGHEVRLRKSLKRIIAIHEKQRLWSKRTKKSIDGRSNQWAELTLTYLDKKNTADDLRKFIQLETSG